MLPTPQKGWRPLLLIAVLTLAIFIVSIISLLSGWLTIFQNLFYLPIILACVYYVKRGFVFSVLLACGYFVLMAIFSNDPVVLQGAIIRVLIFILVAGVITYLSIVRIRAEDALKESEERYRKVADFTYDWEYWVAPDGKFLYVSPSCERITGYRVEEFIQDPALFITVTHPDDRERVSAHMCEQETTPAGVSLEYRIITKSGERKWIGHNCQKVFSEKGTYLGRRAGNRDVTEQKQAEEARRESEQRLIDIIDFLPDATFAIDTAGTVIAWNRAIEELMGVSKADMLGKGDYAYALPAYGERRAVLIDLVLHENVEQERKYALFTRDGDQLIAEAFVQNINGGKGEHIWMIASPLYDRDGRITGAIESIRIVTDRKRAEEALHQANKKLNLLSSITRHDINNQMTVLRGYLTILEEKQSDPTLNEYFQKVTAAANRISAMIRFTKEYEQIGVHAPTWQDCRTLVDTAAKQATLGKITVKNDLPAGIEVFADPLVVKVFYNLMDNAVRYGGKITSIRFSALESGDDQGIVCKDDGDGVIAEEKEKIFERGFGKNTGLGLALSREILSITGITIRETGEPGKGARFEMVVPEGMWRLTGNDT